jgi:flagellar protein FliO/FliZ
MTFPRPTAILAAVTTLLLTAPSALAASSSEDAPINLPKDDAGAVAASSSGGSFVRTIVGLAVVLAVIYGLYWVLKQVKASREGTAAGQGLETVASVPLGTGRSIHLVRAGSELVLLGVSENAVVPIRTYSEEEAMGAGLIPVPELPAPSDEARPATAAPSAALVLRSTLDRLQRVTVRG